MMEISPDFTKSIKMEEAIFFTSIARQFFGFEGGEAVPNLKPI